MLTQHTAAFDPIFFLYHSFIDSLWEIWRTQRQVSTWILISNLSFIESRSTRETAYPVDNDACSSEAHFRNSIMSPFVVKIWSFFFHFLSFSFAPLQNIDGCSNVYTDNLYTYDRRIPSCSLGANCGSRSGDFYLGSFGLKLSRFLFCDRSNGAPHCATKIRLDQPCNGYNQGSNHSSLHYSIESSGEDMCYNSVCIDGICSVDPVSFYIPYWSKIVKYYCRMMILKQLHNLQSEQSLHRRLSLRYISCDKNDKNARKVTSVFEPILLILKSGNSVLLQRTWVLWAVASERRMLDESQWVATLSQLGQRQRTAKWMAHL